MPAAGAGCSTISKEGVSMSEPKAVVIKYYATLREQAGRNDETRQSTAQTAAELYQELCADYGFSLNERQLKVAINSMYQPMSSLIQNGDTVVFIPPVAGG